MRTELLRPAALLRHLLVLTVAAVLVGLGQWQLQRLDAVRDNNARLEARLSAPPIELAEVVDDPAVDDEALEYRRTRARGTFRPEQEVLQRGRSVQGQQGFDVLTPLELTDGGVVLVRRGFVPLAHDTPPVDEAAPPAGEVTVEGILERPVEQPRFGAQDPEQGHLERVFHTDTRRLDGQIDGALFPMVLRTQGSSAGILGVDPLPIPPEAPELDEANHLSYAVQWHAFALLAVGAYGAYLFQRSRGASSGR